MIAITPARVMLVACLLLGAACAARQQPVDASPQAHGAAPTALLGEFTDDYDARYTISATEWRHGNNRFHVIRWDSAGQYLVARNDTANAGDKGLYSRIDWLTLDGMPPYEWAYCYSAYKAPSAGAAGSTMIAKRETPRTGCGGHPFTRMKASAGR